MASIAEEAACTPMPTTSTAAETAESATETTAQACKLKRREKVVNRAKMFGN